MEQSILQFATHILEINHISVHRVRLPLQGEDAIDLGLRRALLDTPTLPSDAEEFFRSRRPNTVYLLTDAFQCHYAVMRLAKNEFLVCGPTLFEPMSPVRFASVAETLDIPPVLHNQLQDYYRQIFVSLSKQTFISIITALAEHIYGLGSFQIALPKAGDTPQWSEKKSLPFHSADTPVLTMEMTERYYQLEKELIHAVAHGEQGRASEITSKLLGFHSSPIFPDTLRGAKDDLLCFNTLLRVAAGWADVHPIHIKALHQKNILLCEELASLDQGPALAQQFVRDYCQLVLTRTLQAYSPLIQRVIGIIGQDLAADLSLKKVAVMVNVNASYLSSLFHQEVGIPLTDYVNGKRIDRAKFLLQTTNLHIKRIVEIVGITDVYYFSRLFKRVTGKTPREYRLSCRENPDLSTQ